MSEVEQVAAENILSIEDVTSSNDVEYDYVDAWGGKKARIASLNAGDLIEWSEASEGEAKRTAGLRLIVKSLVDANGKHICGETEKEQAPYVNIFKKKSHKITEGIVKGILKLNGMNVKAGDDAKKD